MSAGYTVPSTCMACFSAAFDRVWFDEGIGAPVKQTICATCMVPPTSEPSPAMVSVGEFDDLFDADGDDYDEAML